LAKPKSEQFLKDLKIYDAISKQPIQPPIIKCPTDLVLLDHDKTMTYKADPKRVMLSHFLHPWAAEILKEGLVRGFSFAICSTAHVTRLIRQYRDGITDRDLLNRLVIIAEGGSVFAIPELREGLYYDLYEIETLPELICARETVEQVVNEFRRRRNLDVFVNRDLKRHITVENFEGKREITDELVRTIREALNEDSLLDKIWLTTTTNSIEVNVHSLKENVVEILSSYDFGNIVSIGDSRSDIPVFKRTFGIQVPYRDMNIDEITPLEHARVIAIGSEAGGTTTAQLLMHMLEEEKLMHIDYEDFKRTISDALRNGFIHTETISASAIRLDYTFPDALLSKYYDSQSQSENLLKQIYPSLDFLSGRA
jgi:hypothetical protein